MRNSLFSPIQSCCPLLLFLSLTLQWITQTALFLHVSLSPALLQCPFSLSHFLFTHSPPPVEFGPFAPNSLALSISGFSIMVCGYQLCSSTPHWLPIASLAWAECGRGVGPCRSGPQDAPLPALLPYSTKMRTGGVVCQHTPELQTLGSCTHIPRPAYSFTFSHSRGPNRTHTSSHIHTHTWCSGAKGQCARGRAVIIVLTLRSGVARLCQVKCQEKQCPWGVRTERNGKGCLNPHSFQSAPAFPHLQTDQSPLTTAASVHAHTLTLIDTHSLIQHADVCTPVEMDKYTPISYF